MKIAVDRNSLSAINDKNEYIYLFDEEEYDELPKAVHCLKYDYCDFVDINLSK